jgi:AcrR family transcriptional regulator
MDLYRHFARKDELIDLMADEAAAAAAHHRHRAAGRLQHDERPAASARQIVTQALDAGHDGAVAGTDAVLSALGHVTDSPPDLLAAASSNVIAAMRAHGDRRLVVLAPPSVEDQQDRRGLFYRFVRLAMPVMMRAATRDHKAQSVWSKTASSTGGSRAAPASSPTVHTRAATTQDRSPPRQTAASPAPTSPTLCSPPPVTESSCTACRW